MADRLISTPGFNRRDFAAIERLQHGPNEASHD
jgi:hypothetical protein